MSTYVELYVVCEGQTEENFVNLVLGPHLCDWSVTAIPIVVRTGEDRTGKHYRGGAKWAQWQNDIRILMLTHSRRPDIRCTTLIDLYALPTDFPSRAEHWSMRNKLERSTRIEETMASVVNDSRFIPHIQLHEFEALVLACLDSLAEQLRAEQLKGLESLKIEIAGQEPEDVNDDVQTAPSKRLEKHIPSYDKPLNGPDAIMSAGLETVRKACPHFNAWLSRLEALAKD